MIRSEEWNELPEAVMPWTKPNEDIFFATIEKIVTNILHFNQSSFRILKGIGNNEDIKIPMAMTPAGIKEKMIQKIGSVASAEKVPVKVNIHYMIGNHDWFFYIDDPRLNNVRNQVIDALGLANEKDKPFPYYRGDCAVIKEMQDAHRVFAEHGDQFDKTNFQAPHRNASSVGDVVVIKLLNAIPSRIEKYIKHKMGDSIDAAKQERFFKQLKEIDNLRPYTLAPAWITQLIHETEMDEKIVNEAINYALQASLKEFIRNTIVSKDIILKLKMWIARMILSNARISKLSSIIDYTSFGKDRIESYKKYAIGLAKDQEKDFFIMGHTHYAEVVPISNYVDKEGIKRSKIYINTGTWRSLHLRAIDDKSFVSYTTMTIAGFFKSDERKGRPFEFWTGSLALW
jgi:UDP-2,3-diacylglucosamine pyrophosphatase LpxH